MDVIDAFRNAFAEVPWFIPLVVLCAVTKKKRR